MDLSAQDQRGVSQIADDAASLARPCDGPQERCNAMASTNRILVVDDEPGITESVAMMLRYADFEVDVAESGGSALELADEQEFDLIVLDVLLPDVDGIEVTRRIRARNNDVPIVFLSARVGVEERLAGLAAGGDAYVSKPFSLPELVARIRAILRRRGARRLIVGDIVMDLDSGEVTRGGELLTLTETERRLLTYFLENAGRVLTKDEIIDAVWADVPVTANLVETYVRYLRRKLEAAGPPVIHTRRLVGYILSAA